MRLLESEKCKARQAFRRRFGVPAGEVKIQSINHIWRKRVVRCECAGGAWLEIDFGEKRGQVLRSAADADQVIA